MRATGIAPANLFLRWKARTKLPEAHGRNQDQTETHFEKDACYKKKMVNNANRRAKECDIRPGDTVVIERDVRNKYDSFFGTEQFKVRNRFGGMLILEDRNGKIKRRYVNKARKLFGDMESDEALLTFSGGGGNGGDVNGPIHSEDASGQSYLDRQQRKSGLRPQAALRKPVRFPTME
jgi:hypothetical protein